MSRGYKDEDQERDTPWRQSGAECLRETDRALLVRLRDGTEEWFPKSVIHDDSEVFEPGQEGEIVVQGWFARKAGLE